MNIGQTVISRLHGGFVYKNSHYNAARGSLRMSQYVAETSLWDSILEETANARENTVTTKNVILFGKEASGKSTILQAVAREGDSSSSTELNARPVERGPDLGLSYDIVDIQDPSDEELLSRLGVYQLSSSESSDLLNLALSPSTLLNSLVIIILDWERPWTFLSHLGDWLSLLHIAVASIRSSTTGEDRGEYLFELARERIEAFHRAYQEPTLREDGTVVSLPIGSQARRDIVADLNALPLPQGTLSDNIGIPIIVCCTKSDLIDTVEKEMEMSEEQTDFIQQTLRTICLRYGASLFSTSRQHPSTLTKLKAYILNRLFNLPSSSQLPSSHSAEPSSKTTSQSKVPTTGAGALRSFPFNYRTNIVDRDSIMIPSGWDSAGKIRVVSDSFDVVSVSESWRPYLTRAKHVDLEEGKEYTQGMLDLEQTWLNMVSNPNEDRELVLKPSLVKAQDEQDFLMMQYQLQQKEQAKDPRAHFQPSTTSQRPSPNLLSTPQLPSASPELSLSNTPSLVGPMRNTSIALAGSTSNIHSIEEKDEQLAKRKTQITSPPLRSPLSPTSPTVPSPLSPSNGVTSPATPAQTQNEVLANFFQSLLSARKDSNAPRFSSALAKTSTSTIEKQSQDSPSPQS